MDYKIEKMPTDLIANKVKIALSSLGLNERYKAFEYLTDIITMMIKQNNESNAMFYYAIKEIQEKNKISKASINYGLKKLTDQCKNDEILSMSQFHLTKYSLANRTRILIAYTLNHFIH